MRGAGSSGAQTELSAPLMLYSCRTRPNETPLIARTRRARSRQSERLPWPSAVEFSSYGQLSLMLDCDREGR